MVLYNISPDSLLPTWIKFSERSPEHESIAEAAVQNSGIRFKVENIVKVLGL